MATNTASIVEEVGSAVKSSAGQFVIGSSLLPTIPVPLRDRYQSSCQHAEFVGTAQASVLRVRFADGTLSHSRCSFGRPHPEPAERSPTLWSGWFAADAAM